MSASTLARRRARRLVRPPVPTAARRPGGSAAGHVTGSRLAKRVGRPPRDAGRSTVAHAVGCGAGQRLVGRARHLLRDDAGMSTVEYAIGCIAAAAFAAALYSVVSGESVITALTQLVQRALSAGF